MEEGERESISYYFKYKDNDYFMMFFLIYIMDMSDLRRAKLLLGSNIQQLVNDLNPFSGGNTSSDKIAMQIGFFII